MYRNVIVRKASSKDVHGIKEVLDSSKLFPAEYLDNMMTDYLTNDGTEDIWFVAEKNNNTVGFGYCVPEKLTNGTYNLLAIAVKSNLQGNGIGKQMMLFIEQLLKEANNRILIVETSSLSEYELTRNFYLQLGYIKEATIRDFWNDGEDKVIFLKKL